MMIMAVVVVVVVVVMMMMMIMAVVMVIMWARTTICTSPCPKGRDAFRLRSFRLLLCSLEFLQSNKVSVPLEAFRLLMKLSLPRV